MNGDDGGILSTRTWLLAGWVVTLGVTVGVRLWNALTGPLMWGYDAWGHVAYVLFLDLYRAVPWADQGWSYFHPPLPLRARLAARAGGKRGGPDARALAALECGEPRDGGARRVAGPRRGA